MKITNLTLIAASLFIFAGCGAKTTANTSANAATNTAKNENKNADSPPPEAKVSVARPMSISSSAPDTNEAIKFPFDDFPKVETTAKAGDFVLAPSYVWLKDAIEKGVDKTTFIWYAAKMAAPDKENSEVQFISERRKTPNAYIIAIPPGQKAKNGDIVLTWWQTGSGLERAIVVDDKDPISPVVRYLDIDYDNPAMSGDDVTTIGKMDEKIMPDTFVKIKDWDPGTTLAVQDGANLIAVKLIRAAGDKVFVTDRTGRVKVFPKSAAKPVPVMPNVKAGDRVKVPFVGTFKDATVTKIDAKIGRVFIKYDGMPDEEAIAFGDVLKN